MANSFILIDGGSGPGVIADGIPIGLLLTLTYHGNTGGASNGYILQENGDRIIIDTLLGAGLARMRRNGQNNPFGMDRTFRVPKMRRANDQSPLTMDDKEVL